MYNYLLTLSILIPLSMGIAILLSPYKKQARYIALLGSSLTMMIGFFLFYKFDSRVAGIQFEESYWWIKSLGLRYHLGLDGINLTFYLFAVVLIPFVVLSLWASDNPRLPVLLALILMLEATVLGILLALDAFLFYGFWEASSVPLYFMMVFFGARKNLKSARKFLVFSHFGSLLALITIVVLFFMQYEQSGVYSSSLTHLYQVRPDIDIQLWLFAALCFAFISKTPVFPFHSWFTELMEESPVVGVVLVVGLIVKLGVYGFLRFAMPLLPDAVQFYSLVFTILGVMSFLYGGMMAWVQKNFKAFTAYALISQSGLVLVGCMALNGGAVTLSEEAITGVIIKMLSSGASFVLLVLLFGILSEKRGSTSLMEFGGLSARMPLFAFSFLVAVFALMGLPGTGDFIGDYLILSGAFSEQAFLVSLALVGLFIGALYGLRICKLTLFGSLVKESNVEIRDLNPVQIFYVFPFVLFVIFVGIWPNMTLSKIRVSIENFSTEFSTYSEVPSHRTPTAHHLPTTEQNTY